MNDFYDGKFDVLIATTIIESGLDVPWANTMIVDRAHMFGLSQLYQIRGRVGRREEQAYCYLTYPKGLRLSDISSKRLEILQSCNTLGSGFTIASHDMDLRGYGNLIGDEQSGHIKEVGLELYQSMLEEAVKSLKDDEYIESNATTDWVPSLNLGIDVRIPEDLVPDPALRLQLYRQIAQLTTKEQLDSFANSMTDQYGDLPEDVNKLFEIMHLKQMAKRLNIEKIDLGGKAIIFKFKDGKPVNHNSLLKFIDINIGKVKLRESGDLMLFYNDSTNGANEVRRALEFLCD